MDTRIPFRSRPWRSRRDPPTRDPLKLLEQAEKLALDERFQEAASTFSIAADAAEEQGDPELARRLRSDMRRALVLIWVRGGTPYTKRFSEAKFRHVHSICRYNMKPGEEHRSFMITTPSGKSLFVRVNRRNNIWTIKDDGYWHYRFED